LVTSRLIRKAMLRPKMLDWNSWARAVPREESEESSDE
jgi:hypothetical protein